MSRRIVLCMIMKNEAAVIERCLAAAAPLVDAVSLCDTGSDDGTPELAEAFLNAAEIPFRISRHAWVNFGHNRSLSFTAARGLARDLGWDLEQAWTLFLDADMVIEAAEDFSAAQLHADSHQVRLGNADFWYYLSVLARLALDWHSVGATHEYWAADGAGPGARLDSLTINHVADGGTRHEKFERDIRLLETELLYEPENPRSMFYLAQSYYDLGNYAEARGWYLRRAASAGWEEEGWYAAYKAALCLVHLGQWDAGVGELLAAWQRRPTRAEPLYQLAREARLRGKQALAMLAAEKAVQIPAPTDLLFIDGYAHANGPREELSICAFYTGQRRIGREACEAQLHDPGVPAGVREIAARNLSYYVERLEADEVWEIAGDLPAPALARAARGYVVAGRLRDAHDDGITPANSADSDDTGVHWLTYDDALREAAAEVLDADLGRPGLVASACRAGIDDVRLVRWDDAWWLSGTCPDPVPGEQVVVLGRLAAGAPTFEHLVAVTLEERAACTDGRHWLPFVWDGRLHLLASSGPLQVLEVDPRSGVCRTVAQRTAALDLRHYRGAGPPIPWGAGLLYTVEERANVNGQPVTMQRFVEIDHAFNVSRISQAFVFEQVGAERTRGHCLSHDGSRVLLAYASGAGQARIVGVSVEQVERLLRPLDDLTPMLNTLRQRDT